MSKKIAKKETIVQAAIEVFGKNSFRDSNISEIARRADVAEGTIYQYFKNKEDLFFSIPIEKTREFCGGLELHLQGIIGPFNKIRKFIWYYLYFFKTNPEYGRILMLEMRVSRSFVKTKTYGFLRKSTSEILKIIKEGQEEGFIRGDANPYVIRQLALGILEHVVTRWLLKGEKYDLMDSYEDISRLVIDGIDASKMTGRTSESSGEGWR
ncbi:MAG TPA: TetR/AcrR family transcriptional regulator [Thermodesulfobacteriota bacterium]|nr:TetR/AcrR family transcriptional regulator [Thermodesulfobacteriota bacterium]